MVEVQRERQGPRQAADSFPSMRELHKNFEICMTRGNNADIEGKYFARRGDHSRAGERYGAAFIAFENAATSAKKARIDDNLVRHIGVRALTSYFCAESEMNSSNATFAEKATALIKNLNLSSDDVQEARTEARSRSGNIEAQREIDLAKDDHPIRVQYKNGISRLNVVNEKLNYVISVTGATLVSAIGLITTTAAAAGVGLGVAVTATTGLPGIPIMIVSGWLYINGYMITEYGSDIYKSAGKRYTAFKNLQEEHQNQGISFDVAPPQGYR